MMMILRMDVDLSSSKNNIVIRIRRRTKAPPSKRNAVISYRHHRALATMARQEPQTSSFTHALDKDKRFIRRMVVYRKVS